jgi:hypothetical protein
MSSPFVAAAMSEALCSAADLCEASADTRVRELNRYLRDTREPDGSWRFAPDEDRWPPDADSTACALAALLRAGSQATGPILGQVLAMQRDADGLIRPWLRWYTAAAERLDGNVGDAIVTANVLLATSRAGEDDSGLSRALEAHVRSRGLERLATVYYDALPVRTYYLARVLAPISSRGPIALALRTFLARIDPRGLNAVDLAGALAAAALLEVVPTVHRILPLLLALQQVDGAWPAARWFVDPADKVWCSAAFSTAVAMEALGFVEDTTLAGN